MLLLWLSVKKHTSWYLRSMQIHCCPAQGRLLLPSCCVCLASTAAPHLQGLSARDLIPAQLSLLCSSSRSVSVQVTIWLAQGRYLRNCFDFPLQASSEVHKLDLSLLQHCCCRCHTSPAPPCAPGVPRCAPAQTPHLCSSSLCALSCASSSFWEVTLNRLTSTVGSSCTGSCRHASTAPMACNTTKRTTGP